MKYDVIIVGGGIAGLTSAAFLTKSGYKVLLCEKEEQAGGLVNSFDYDGFLYDGGVRGIIDSGIVKPMLKQLDIDIEFTRSIVSIGIENQMTKVETIESLNDYRNMLVNLYPENEEDIDLILKEMGKVMDYMDILYGIENPLFKDLKNDKEYLFKTLLPWVFKFMVKSGKIKRFKAPVYEYLRKLTKNESLIDIISQHFFQETPASFALSYFSLYLDYEYPVNGTIDLVNRIRDYIVENGGVIKTKTKVVKVNPEKKTLLDDDNNKYNFEIMIWAADMNQLYKAIDIEQIQDEKTKVKIINQKNLLIGKRGGDSIYSLFLGVDLDKDYFKERASAHCFYTPNKIGQSQVMSRLKTIKHSKDQNEINQWMNDYLEYTTYEIAIPSLRNSKLAPQGKTGLVVSVLMDYDFIKNIKELGFYEEFKKLSESKMIDVLNNTIYEGLKEKIIHRFSSTPLTLERLSGNLDGGITGWAFTNDSIPAISKMTKVAKSCLTPVPNVLQAGQWTFSPSGLPISILTGKIAVDKAIKTLKKRKAQT